MPESESKELALKENQLFIRSIVTIKTPIEYSSLNLLAPIVMNTELMLGRQVVRTIHHIEQVTVYGLKLVRIQTAWIERTVLKMLVLSRKIGESIVIQDQIEVTVLGVEGDNVRIGISAPKDVDIFRKEVYQSIQQSNRESLCANTGGSQCINYAAGRLQQK